MMTSVGGGGNGNNGGGGGNNGDGNNNNGNGNNNGDGNNGDGDGDGDNGDNGDPEKIREFSLQGTNDVPQCNVSVSPNPTQGMVTVAINNVSSKAVALTVIDQTGKILQQNTMTVTGGILQTELNLDRMPSGIYFLKIQSGNAVRMERVVKF